jgi:lipopolysaccharide/colanic/teichoic acid biosynthesis glycosyltransferase
MALPLWVRKLSVKLRFRNSRGNSFYLDEKRFRFEVARERMRVDRNGSPLAVLTIELPSDRATPRDFDFLGRVLTRRLRITDTIGCLSNGIVGVLLPDTSKSGAWKVASDICAFYPVGHDRPNCDVIVYPDERPQRQDGEAMLDLEPSGDGLPSGIDALLAQATPLWKRSIDVIGAIVGLVITSPVILLSAAAIRVTTGGPMFYVQEREGLGGRRFRMYKLRTMRTDAEQRQAEYRDFSEQDGPAFKMTNDPRTTWIGRFLRACSVDELPQLWNVLRGEMSLVGPRPLPTRESRECLPWQRQRLWVTPGLTCIWQVKARNTVPFVQWMRMDLEYVRNRSLLRDLRLLASTPSSILLQRGPR